MVVSEVEVMRSVMNKREEGTEVDIVLMIVALMIILVMVMIIQKMVIMMEVLVVQCSNAVLILPSLKCSKRLKSFLCASHEVEFSSGDQR